MIAQILIDAKAQEIHSLLLSIPIVPTGHPGKDRFFHYVARYQQARTVDEYAALALQCADEMCAPELQENLEVCYTWLGWLSRWQVEQIVRQQ